MTIHIADPETDAMARELARLWNTTITEAVRISIIDALEQLKASPKKESGAGRRDANPRPSR